MNRNEPKPSPVEHLAPPDWLTERGKAHWRETVPALAKLGLFTEIDQWAWGLACAAWGHWRELAELIEQDGMILPTETGGKLHPALRLEEKWAESYMKVAKEFGATPASRVHLSVQPPQGNELDDWLGAKNARKAKSRFFRSKDGEAN